MSALKYDREGEASECIAASVLDEEADNETQASPSTRSRAQPPIPKDGPSNSDEPSDDRTPDDTAHPIPPEMPHPVRDFDDSANPMWSLHLGEAKSHDEARIHTLKDDMDTVLIFVCIHISVVIVYSNVMHHRPGWLILRCPHVLSCR